MTRFVRFLAASMGLWAFLGSAGLAFAQREPTNLLELISAPSQDPREQQALAEQVVAEIQAANDEVEMLLEAARSSSDLLRLSCVNNKVYPIRGLLVASQTAKRELEGAIADENLDHAEHAVARLSLALRQSAELLLDAKSCAGELADELPGQATVEVRVAGQPFEPSPSEDYSVDPDGYVRPAAATPYE